MYVTCRGGGAHVFMGKEEEQRGLSRVIHVQANKTPTHTNLGLHQPSLPQSTLSLPVLEHEYFLVGEGGPRATELSAHSEELLDRTGEGA